MALEGLLRGKKAVEVLSISRQYHREMRIESRESATGVLVFLVWSHALV